jgi:hypothetical protein
VCSGVTTDERAVTSGDVVEPLSPELALVDERLNRSARLELPSADPAIAARTDEARRPRKTGWAVVAGGGLLIALATSVSALLLVGNDGSQVGGPGEGTATERSQASSQDLELRWKPVRGATLYNVILWKEGVRVLDLWPRRASVRLPKERLGPGTYQWFVYPMLGDGAGRRYGRVTARGTVRT